MLTINIIADSSTQHASAEKLAAELAIPFDASLATDYSLHLTTAGICLQKNNSSSSPLIIDFTQGKAAYRQQNTSLKREALARALGLKNHTQPYIVDATAGLGRDSFILAGLGFEITLLERSPIIQVLLEDGIARAQQNEKTATAAKRMRLFKNNAIEWLQTREPQERPDIIYLDPMFPTRTKSSLVKKDMQIFHDIVGNDDDGAQLLTTALACATQRVVVKRPRLAPTLTDITPTFSHIGKSCRFDVYLIKNLQ
jgi:16S rRNA (guanine1516-N2)-methyltransferase